MGGGARGLEFRFADNGCCSPRLASPSLLLKLPAVWKEERICEQDSVHVHVETNELCTQSPARTGR